LLHRQAGDYLSNGNIRHDLSFLCGIQESLDRLSDKQPTTEPMMVISALSSLSQADLMLIQEYLCLRESGPDQDTAYSFMDGRHKSARKAMRRLSEEYSKQENAMKAASASKRVKPVGKSQARQDSSSVKEYLSRRGYRGDYTPADSIMFQADRA
jgi:hypothetical protein